MKRLILIAMAILWINPVKAFAGENLYSEILENASEADYRALECVVYNESARADCPLETNVAVIETVLNRVLSDEWPNTIYDVCHDHRFGRQFCDWEYTAEASYQEEAISDAIEYVIENGMTVLPSTSYTYFATKMQSLGKNHIWVGLRKANGNPKKTKGMYFCEGKR